MASSGSSTLRHIGSKSRVTNMTFNRPSLLSFTLLWGRGGTNKGVLLPIGDAWVASLSSLPKDESYWSLLAPIAIAIINLNLKAG